MTQRAPLVLRRRTIRNAKQKNTAATGEDVPSFPLFRCPCFVVSHPSLDVTLAYLLDEFFRHTSRLLGYPAIVNRVPLRAYWPLIVENPIYAVNPGYPRALKSSTDSTTTSFKGVTCVNPSSSSALVVTKLRLYGTSFVKPGSPRGTLGMPSSTAALTCLCHLRQVRV